MNKINKVLKNQFSYTGFGINDVALIGIWLSTALVAALIESFT
jgi:hypothetical protein